MVEKCVDSGMHNCQERLVDIQRTTNAIIYQLNTIGSEKIFNPNGDMTELNALDFKNNYGSTVLRIAIGEGDN